MSDQITHIRQAVTLKLDDTLDKGTAIVTYNGENPDDDVVVRMNSNPWASLLMAFSRQVIGDMEAISKGEPLPIGQPIDPQFAKLMESIDWDRESNSSAMRDVGHELARVGRRLESLGYEAAMPILAMAMDFWRTSTPPEGWIGEANGRDIAAGFAAQLMIEVAHQGEIDEESV